jgi:divalent metal cation (Fe/Co/Zn/Cd) transporter
MVVNFGVSAVISRGAQATESPALAGDATHLRTDAISSAAVLIALALVSLTGAQWLDPAVALAVAAVIVVSGVRLLSRSSRVLVDEALPPDEVEAIRHAIEEFGPRGVVGYHELRTRRAGSRRYVDLHVQFRSGTSLEDAHRTAHELQDRIGSRLRGADVLIHLEPEDRVRPGERLPGDGGSEVEGDRSEAGPSGTAGGAEGDPGAERSGKRGGAEGDPGAERSRGRGGGGGSGSSQSPVDQTRRSAS